MFSDIHVSTGLTLKSLLCPSVNTYFKETFEHVFILQNIWQTHNNLQQHITVCEKVAIKII